MTTNNIINTNINSTTNSNSNRKTSGTRGISGPSVKRESNWGDDYKLRMTADERARGAKKRAAVAKTNEEVNRRLKAEADAKFRAEEEVEVEETKAIKTKERKIKPVSDGSATTNSQNPKAMFKKLAKEIISLRLEDPKQEFYQIRRERLTLRQKGLGSKVTKCDFYVNLKGECVSIPRANKVNSHSTTSAVVTPVVTPFVRPERKRVNKSKKVKGINQKALFNKIIRRRRIARLHLLHLRDRRIVNGWGMAAPIINKVDKMSTTEKRAFLNEALNSGKRIASAGKLIAECTETSYAVAGHIGVTGHSIGCLLVSLATQLPLVENSGDLEVVAKDSGCIEVVALTPVGERICSRVKSELETINSMLTCGEILFSGVAASGNVGNALDPQLFAGDVAWTTKSLLHNPINVTEEMVDEAIDRYNVTLLRNIVMPFDKEDVGYELNERIVEFLANFFEVDDDYDRANNILAAMAMNFGLHSSYELLDEYGRYDCFHAAFGGICTASMLRSATGYKYVTDEYDDEEWDYVNDRSYNDYDIDLQEFAGSGDVITYLNEHNHCNATSMRATDCNIELQETGGVDSDMRKYYVSSDELSSQVWVKVWFDVEDMFLCKSKDHKDAVEKEYIILASWSQRKCAIVLRNGVIKISDLTIPDYILQFREDFDGIDGMYISDRGIWCNKTHSFYAWKNNSFIFPKRDMVGEINYEHLYGVIQYIDNKYIVAPTEDYPEARGGVQVELEENIKINAVLYDVNDNCVAVMIGNNRNTFVMHNCLYLHKGFDNVTGFRKRAGFLNRNGILAMYPTLFNSEEMVVDQLAALCEPDTDFLRVLNAYDGDFGSTIMMAYAEESFDRGLETPYRVAGLFLQWGSEDQRGCVVDGSTISDEERYIAARTLAMCSLADCEIPALSGDLSFRLLNDMLKCPHAFNSGTFRRGYFANLESVCNINDAEQISKMPRIAERLLSYAHDFFQYGFIAVEVIMSLNNAGIIISCSEAMRSYIIEARLTELSSHYGIEMPPLRYTEDWNNYPEADLEEIDLYNSGMANPISSSRLDIYPEFQKIWNTYGWSKEEVPARLAGAIHNFKLHGESSLVDSKLNPFIGRFNVNLKDSEKVMADKMEWWDKIAVKLASYNNDKVKNIVNKMTADKELILRGVTGRENSAPKFVKFITKELGLDLNKEKWFVPFHTMRDKSNSYTIVGTKDPVSVVGMASLSESWTSCQTLAKREKWSFGLWSDVINSSAIVLYTTNNRQVPFCGVNSVVREEMLTRVILRLVHVTTPAGEKLNGVVLDRFYPNIRHAGMIIDKVRDICDANGLLFFAPKSLNQSNNDNGDTSSMSIVYNVAKEIYPEGKKWATAETNEFPVLIYNREAKRPYLDNVSKRVVNDAGDMMVDSIKVGLYTGRDISVVMDLQRFASKLEARMKFNDCISNCRQPLINCLPKTRGLNKVNSNHDINLGNMMSKLTLGIDILSGRAWEEYSALMQELVEIEHEIEICNQNYLDGIKEDYTVIPRSPKLNCCISDKMYLFAEETIRDIEREEEAEQLLADLRNEGPGATIKSHFRFAEDVRDEEGEDAMDDFIANMREAEIDEDWIFDESPTGQDFDTIGEMNDNPEYFWTPSLGLLLTTKDIDRLENYIFECNYTEAFKTIIETPSMLNELRWSAIDVLFNSPLMNELPLGIVEEIDRLHFEQNAYAEEFDTQLFSSPAEEDKAKIDSFLSKFGLYHRNETGISYAGICPVCGKFSVSIWVNKCWINVKCFRGCGKDAISRTIGVTNKDRMLSGSLDMWKDCRDIRADVPNEWDRFKQNRHKYSKYVYKYENGDYAYTIFSDKTGCKSRFLTGEFDPEIRKLYHQISGERTLYRLPELIQAVKDGKPVFIVEGEHNVQKLNKMGFAATTNSHGCSMWMLEFNKYFNNATVILIPDNDDCGQRFAKSLEVCLKKHAASISRIPINGSLEEFLNNDTTKDFLTAMVKEIEFLECYNPSPAEEELVPVFALNLQLFAEEINSGDTNDKSPNQRKEDSAMTSKSLTQNSTNVKGAFEVKMHLLKPYALRCNTNISLLPLDALFRIFGKCKSVSEVVKIVANVFKAFGYGSLTVKNGEVRFNDVTIFNIVDDKGFVISTPAGEMRLPASDMVSKVIVMEKDMFGKYKKVKSITYKKASDNRMSPAELLGGTFFVAPYMGAKDGKALVGSVGTKDVLRSMHINLLEVCIANRPDTMNEFYENILRGKQTRTICCPHKYYGEKSYNEMNALGIMQNAYNFNNKDLEGCMKLFPKIASEVSLLKGYGWNLFAFLREMAKRGFVVENSDGTYTLFDKAAKFLTRYFKGMANSAISEKITASILLYNEGFDKHGATGVCYVSKTFAETIKLKKKVSISVKSTIGYRWASGKSIIDGLKGKTYTQDNKVTPDCEILVDGLTGASIKYDEGFNGEITKVSMKPFTTIDGVNDMSLEIIVEGYDRIYSGDKLRGYLGRIWKGVILVLDYDMYTDIGDNVDIAVPIGACKTPHFVANFDSNLKSLNKPNMEVGVKVRIGNDTLVGNYIHETDTAFEQPFGGILGGSRCSVGRSGLKAAFVEMMGEILGNSNPVVNWLKNSARKTNTSWKEIMLWLSGKMLNGSNFGIQAAIDDYPSFLSMNVDMLSSERNQGFIFCTSPDGTEFETPIIIPPYDIISRFTYPITDKSSDENDYTFEDHETLSKVALMPSVREYVELVKDLLSPNSHSCENEISLALAKMRDELISGRKMADMFRFKVPSICAVLQFVSWLKPHQVVVPDWAYALLKPTENGRQCGVFHRSPALNGFIKLAELMSATMYNEMAAKEGLPIIDVKSFTSCMMVSEALCGITNGDSDGDLGVVYIMPERLHYQVDHHVKVDMINLLSRSYNSVFEDKDKIKITDCRKDGETNVTYAMTTFNNYKVTLEELVKGICSSAMGKVETAEGSANMYYAKQTFYDALVEINSEIIEQAYYYNDYDLFEELNGLGCFEKAAQNKIDGIKDKLLGSVDSRTFLNSFILSYAEFLAAECRHIASQMKDKKNAELLKVREVYNVAEIGLEAESLDFSCEKIEGLISHLRSAKETLHAIHPEVDFSGYSVDYSKTTFWNFAKINGCTDYAITRDLNVMKRVYDNNMEFSLLGARAIVKTSLGRVIDSELSVLQSLVNTANAFADNSFTSELICNIAEIIDTTSYSQLEKEAIADAEQIPYILEKEHVGALIYSTIEIEGNIYTRADAICAKIKEKAVAEQIKKALNTTDWKVIAIALQRYGFVNGNRAFFKAGKYISNKMNKVAC